MTNLAEVQDEVLRLARVPNESKVRDIIKMVSRGLPLLDMKERDRRLVTFFIGQGRNCGWTIYTGTDCAASIANQMNWDRGSVSKALQGLYKDGRVIKRRDHQGRWVFLITQHLCNECWEALERQRVRSALGYELWGKVGGDDELADVLFSMEELQEGKRFTDRVRKALREWQKSKFTVVK